MKTNKTPNIQVNSINKKTKEVNSIMYHNVSQVRTKTETDIANEQHIKDRVFTQLRHNRGLTYQKAGDQVGLSASRMRDLEKRAEKIITHVIYQPEPFYFLDKAVEMDDVKNYLKQYQITRHTLISYIIDALSDDTWAVNLTEEQLTCYGIEVLELERQTYNTLIRWSTIRTIKDVLNVSEQEINQIRQMSKKKRKHLVEQTHAWCKTQKINIDTYPIVSRTHEPEPLLKEHYSETSHAPISELYLPSRLEDALIENNIRTINDVISKSPRELCSLKGVGRKSIQKIIKKTDYYFKFVLNHDPTDKTNHIRTLNLEIRALHALNRCRIKTIKDLLNTPYSDIKNARNVGQKTINDVLNKLTSWATDYNVDISQTTFMKTAREDLNQNEK